MSNTDKLIQRFLTKFHSEEVKEALQLLEFLIEKLEIKNDPEIFEIQFVDTATQAIEKLSLLEGILKERYHMTLKGDKVQNLYDNYSTKNLFD